MGLAVNVPVVGAGRIVMPFKFHRNGRHHIPRQKFRVTNWRDYEAALRSRGSLTIWFTAEAIAANQLLRRAIMDENGGGAGRFVRALRRAIVRG
jgi:hypothetical protein